MDGTTVLNEKLRHSEAFEYYYFLGEKRNLEQVAVRFGVSKRSADRWSKSFNWQQRVIQRDAELAKKTAEKNIESIVKIKADYRNEIKMGLGAVKGAIATALRALGAYNKKNKTPDLYDLERDGPTFKVMTTAFDLEKLMNCFEKLVKLDMLLLGEDTEKVGVEVQTWFDIAKKALGGPAQG